MLELTSSSASRQPKPAVLRSNRYWHSLSLVALLAFFTPSGTRAEDRWTAVGPMGGFIAALTSNPSGGTLYAGTSAGIFKSTDRAAHWGAANGDLPVRAATQGLTVEAIAVGAPPAEIVYASFRGLGLFRSRDGGNHWERAETGLIGGPARILAAHPTLPGTVYTAISASLYRTTDAGDHWTTLKPIPTTISNPSPLALVVEPSADSTLYVAFHWGLLKTTDGGESWQDLTLPTSGGGFIQQLTIDPNAPGTLYAAWSSQANQTVSLFRSLDGGATWTTLTPGLPASTRQLTALVAAPTAPNQLYASLSSGEVLGSSDGGAHWTVLDDTFDYGPLLLPDAAVHGVLYAASGSVGTPGVFKSDDGGRSWTFRSEGIAAHTIEALVVDPKTPSVLYARRFWGGLLKSTDAGRSWQAIGESSSAAHAAELAIDPLDPRVLYAAVDEVLPPFEDRISHLFKSVDGGLHWTLIFTPDGALIETVDVDPQLPAILHAGGAGGTFRSTDAGAHWRRIDELGRLSLIDLARDPVATGVLYAVASDSPSGSAPTEGLLFRSTDRGATWTTVGQGVFVTLALAPGAPGAPSKLYASDGSTRVLESTDGGAHWTRIALLPEVRQLLVDPRVSSTLFAVGKDGVWRSDDEGTIWRLWNQGLANVHVSDLVFDPQTPARLYVATRGGSVSTRFSTTAPCESGPTQLCLEDGRFRVAVAWKDFDGNTGVGTTRSLTDDTGAFWFFGPDNIELTVKVLDGRAVNGKFWVFYGSLTNVEFTLTVTDTATNRQRVYQNPMGTFASAGHTDSF